MSTSTYRAIAAILIAGAMGSSTVLAQQATKPIASSANPLVDRIWMEKSPPNGLPGVMIALLSNGSLLQDSCWETYTISSWKQTGASRIAWTENGAPISADVISVSKTDLTLDIGAGKSKTRHSYSVAKSPFICPDMKK